MSRYSVIIEFKRVFGEKRQTPIIEDRKSLREAENAFNDYVSMYDETVSEVKLVCNYPKEIIKKFPVE